MPLPFLAAIPVLIATFSSTTLVVGGALAAVAVVATIGAFCSAVKKLIDKYNARKAVVEKIQSSLENGDYNTVTIGLRDEDEDYLGIERIEVSKDVDITRGEVIYS